MLRPIVARLLQSAVIALGASLFIFFLVHLTGDPLQGLRLTPGVSGAEITRLKAELGLDRPLPEQYLSWLTGIARGDLGESLSAHRPVASLIAERIPATLELAGLALIISFVLAITIGSWQAKRFRGYADRFVSAATFTAVSTPVFWVALLLQFGLGYLLYDVTGAHLFYVSGQWSPGSEGDLVNGLQHLALPLLTIVIAQTAVWVRYQRASMAEVLRAPYLTSARALGIPERTIFLRFALPNSAAPLVAVAAADLPMLFSGAVITESVFAWPGMGSLFLLAVERADYPLVMGILFITALAVIIFNALADVVGRLLDPRGAHEVLVGGKAGERAS